MERLVTARRRPEPVLEGRNLVDGGAPGGKARWCPESMLKGPTS